jgi:asparagine synthetase B (glutamine-hydrolysing)
VDGLGFDPEAGLWVAQLEGQGHPADPRTKLRVDVMGAAGPSPLSHAVAEPVEVLFQGVLTNADELRSRYGLDPATSGSPADVVAAVYARRGASPTFRELRGVYAAIVADGASGSVVAARDRFGTHPLFYATGPDGVLFSSTIDALLRSGSVTTALNRPMMVDHLRHRSPDKGETYFEAIRRVPPSHVLEIRGSAVRVTRYWDLVPEDGRFEWNEHATTEDFADVMSTAVRRCMSVGPTGIYLSGGIDSVSVGAIATDVAAGLGVEPPLALMLGFSDPSADEREIQRNVAAQLGLRDHMVQLEDVTAGAGLLASGLELSRAFAAPLLNYWLPGYCRLSSDARAQGIEVIMSGAGGDEWLSVGPSYTADLLSRFDFGGVRRMWDMWGSAYPLSTAEKARSLWKYGARPIIADRSVRLMRRYAPELLVRRRRRLDVRHLPAWLAPDRALRHEAIERRTRMRDLVNERADLPYYLEEGRFGVEHAIVSMETEEDFELSRRIGFLKMHPYWDPDAVEFLARTPPGVLMEAGGKGLARTMLAERFPDLGFESQRKVVSTDAFRTTALLQGGAAWQAMDGTPLLAELGIVDGTLVRREADDILASGSTARSYRLWDLLSLESWARGHTGDLARSGV